jgi:scyllo-inositol 2-dehydrogenase (NADP+)
MSNKIKVGIWGLGRAGYGMHVKELEKYPDQFELICGYDNDPARRDNFSENTGIKVYSNEEEFLTDSEIDLITIATRSPDHPAHCIKALETGKYVFLEKPIALTYADALKIKAASEKHPGKLFLRHNRRFEAPFNHICEIIDSGILGDVYEVKLRRNGYQRRADWQTLIACGGGQLNNWGPHIIDHGLQFLGSPVKEIWSDLKRIAAVGDAEDHLKVILKGENGIVVDLEISGGAAIKEPEYLIFATKGALSATGDEILLKYIDPEQKLPEIKAESANPPLDAGFGNAEPIRWIEKTIKAAPAIPTEMHSIWSALYDSIREGKTYRVSLDEGIEVVRVTEMVKKGTRFEKAD